MSLLHLLCLLLVPLFNLLPLRFACITSVQLLVLLFLLLLQSLVLLWSVRLAAASFRYPPYMTKRAVGLVLVGFSPP